MGMAFGEVSVLDFLHRDPKGKPFRFEGVAMGTLSGT